MKREEVRFKKEAVRKVSPWWRGAWLGLGVPGEGRPAKLRGAQPGCTGTARLSVAGVPQFCLIFVTS
jgi:hypothetical protein